MHFPPPIASQDPDDDDFDADDDDFVDDDDFNADDNDDNFDADDDDFDDVAVPSSITSIQVRFGPMHLGVRASFGTPTIPSEKTTSQLLLIIPWG